MEDPRDGLMLFGPLDEASAPYGVNCGVIGTKAGIRKFKAWVATTMGPVANLTGGVARPFFPGFETVFGIPWKPDRLSPIAVPEDELTRYLHAQDGHVRVFNTVDCYASRIVASQRDCDTAPSLWFVVVPDDVYKYCRPTSRVEKGQISIRRVISGPRARRLIREPALFDEMNREAEAYRFEAHFRNQLKAKLLPHGIATQVVRESTLAPDEYVDSRGKPIRDLSRILGHVAWTLSTATYYKVGGRPWKLADVRDGVCYLGLVFKIQDPARSPKNACCAAQMFLDSGDGVVFRGALGPWYNPKRGEFHLHRRQARELVELAITAYRKANNERVPHELFIHGRTRFDNEEWAGFCEGVDDRTALVGVVIRPTSSPKLYRAGEYPVLRGLAWIFSDQLAFLWTNGYVPRLQTSTALEVPNPLRIEICKGNADIHTVMSDILSLTKLNYNSCIYADGIPVTLRFADAVGEILTAAPPDSTPPLSFRYYI
ncbi:hypothetical protein JXD38_11590 [candidate division WOR-3 bacterium]|nr:hypothetical protein [candidate division WOR-3 bacterium]